VLLRANYSTLGITTNVAGATEPTQPWTLTAQ